jgi:hypothetical protein
MFDAGRCASGQNIHAKRLYFRKRILTRVSLTFYDLWVAYARIAGPRPQTSALRVHFSYP